MVDTIEPTLATLKKTFRSRKTQSHVYRKEQLKAFMTGITEMEEELCEAVFKDLGRTKNVTEITEILGLKAACKHDIDHVKSYSAEFTEHSELLLIPAKTIIRYEPLGVAAIYGSWNYPLMVVLKPLIQCITAGNCAILKPSEFAPETSKAVKNFVEKYLDNEAYAVIEGGVEVSVKLNAQKLDLICFTGSTFVGKIVAQAAAKNMIPCIMELGGKCPVIVDQDADIDFAAGKLAFAKFNNSGQTCVAPDYIFVHEKIIKQFVETMIVKLREMYGEKPTGSDQMGKMINEFHTKRVEELIQGAGGKIVAGGKVTKDIKYIEPTIILEPDLDSKLMEEEIFGPVLPLFPFTQVSDVINFVNDRDKPLAVYYFGRQNSRNSIRVRQETSSGGFVVNECMIQLLSHYQGFGGVGQSGYGRYGGYEGFKNFSNRKGCLIKGPPPTALRPLLVPPYTESKMGVFRKFGVTGLNVTQDGFLKAFLAFTIFTALAIKYYFYSE